MNTTELKALAESILSTVAQLEDAQGEIRALRATEQNLRDRLAQVEAEHAALKEELEAEREETKRWLNAAKWEQEIRKQAEMIADKAVTEHAALLKAISDAEPVAWCDPTNADPAQSVTFSKLTATKWPHIYTRPLYTLNGIKK